MSTREVVFLGTASQVPTRTRNHNAIFLAWDDLGIVFDPGEGTQRQLTLAGIAPSRITHIVITHFHGDHCLGLAGLVQRLSLDRVSHPVEVVYPASGQLFFERLRHASIFHDVSPVVPKPFSVEPGCEFEVTRAGRFRLVAASLEHSVPCCGYRLQEDDGRRMLPERLEQAGVRGAAVGELQRQGRVTVEGREVRLEDVSEARPGQSFALVMDTRPCPGAERLMRDADIVVCESTYLHGEAREAHDHFHTTARQAAELARAGGVRRLALTHFSQRYDNLAPFAEEASAVHGDVAVAEDLSRVAVPRRPV
jgi:ribonuclease Z